MGRDLSTPKSILALAILLTLPILAIGAHAATEPTPAPLLTTEADDKDITLIARLLDIVPALAAQQDEPLQEASLSPEPEHLASGAIGATTAALVFLVGGRYWRQRQARKEQAPTPPTIEELLLALEAEEEDTTDAPRPPAGLQGILHFGQDAVDRGAYAEALGWFDCAIQLDPDAQQVHLCRGLCLAELDRSDEALGAFATAVAIDPTDGLARFHLAKAHGSLGHERDALEALAPLVSALPELAKSAYEDPDFAGLRDHPSFLSLVGRL